MELSKIKDLDDRELITMTKEGTLQAFDELVRRYEPRIHSICYRMTRNYTDARDLAQDVFVKAYNGLKKFDGRSSFYTWVYRIAVNTCINFLKRQKPTKPLSGIERAVGTHPVERHEQRKLHEDIDQAIKQLPKMQRLAFTLRQLEGMSYQEIAQKLGRSIGTIKANHHQAVRKLREILKGVV